MPSPGEAVLRLQSSDGEVKAENGKGDWDVEAAKEAVKETAAEPLQTSE